LSRELATLKMPRVLSIPAFQVESGGDQTPTDKLQALLRELRARAVKSGKFSALNVVFGQKPSPGFLVSGNIHSTQSHVVGSTEITDEEQLGTVLHFAEGKVDVVLLDVDRKPFGPVDAVQTAKSILNKTALLTYLDSRVWVEAVEDQVVRLLQEELIGSQIVIAGSHPRSHFLSLRFAERGAAVTLLRESDESSVAPLEQLRSLSLAGGELIMSCVDFKSDEARARLSSANVIVVWPATEPWFDAQMASLLAHKSYLVDAGIGAILPDGITEAHRRGCLVLRVNIWPALTGALSGTHESFMKNKDAFGWQLMDGVPVVAGGAMGHSGDVIVDSVHHPMRVIGVCDGRGGVRFRFDKDEADRVHRVQAEINRRLVAPQFASTTAG
jgi:hypothetical protein